MTFDQKVKHGRPRRIPISIFWCAFLLGIVILVAGYYFENNSRLSEKILTAIVYSLLALFLCALFFPATIVLFSPKPIIEIGEDKVAFPIIGFTISRAETLDVIPQRSGMSEHWRVVVRLRTANQRQFRAWLLWPVAYAFGNKLYILPLFLAPPRGAIMRQIVEALSAKQ